MLVAAPESLTGASFQMSFAAVIALIAAWEMAAGWRRRLHERAERRAIAGCGGWRRRSRASLATTLIASIATGAFAAYHFNRLSLLGVVANLLGVPLTGFWIMPWGLLAMLLMPFGLERFALVPMGWGVDGLNAIAFHVAAWPQAADAGAVAAGRQPVADDPGRPVVLPVAPALALGRPAGRRCSACCSGPATAPDLLMSEDGRVLGLRDQQGRGACRLGAHRPLRQPTPGRGAAARRAPSKWTGERRRAGGGLRLPAPGSAAGARDRGGSPW